MTTLRTVALGIAAAVLLWTAAPALAGPGRGGPVGGGQGGHGLIAANRPPSKAT